MDFVKEIKDSIRILRYEGLKKNGFFTSAASPYFRTKAPERILICRPNHRLGNLLLVTPLLQEITATFPTCKIDLFVKGNLAPVIFKSYPNVENIIQLPKRLFPNVLKYLWSWISIGKKSYDLVIDVDKNSSSGRLSAYFSHSKYKISGHDDLCFQLLPHDYHHHAKYPVYNFRNWLTTMGLDETLKPLPLVNLRLTALEIVDGYNTLNQLTENSNRTICLFTHATGRKCYTSLWWEQFYERLKQEFPEANIIEVLPIHNVSKLSFKARSFYSRDIRKICAVIANTDLFIGGDSGMMHLAGASGTPTLGLFSVTDENLYAPYGNNNSAINTNATTIDDWMKIIGDVLSKKDSVLKSLQKQN